MALITAPTSGLMGFSKPQGLSSLTAYCVSAAHQQQHAAGFSVGNVRLAVRRATVLPDALVTTTVPGLVFGRMPVGRYRHVVSHTEDILADCLPICGHRPGGPRLSRPLTKAAQRPLAGGRVNSTTGRTTSSLPPSSTDSGQGERRKIGPSTAGPVHEPSRLPG